MNRPQARFMQMTSSAVSNTPDAAPTLPSATDMRMASCGGQQLPCWQVAWAQVIGVHHARVTEDSVAHHSPDAQTLFLSVCDGVGGGARGDVASATASAHAVAMPAALVGDAAGIAQWMDQAEALVQMRLREVSHSPGATTLTAAWLTQRPPLPPSLAGKLGKAGDVAQRQPDQGYAHGHILRVGDSRIYTYDGAQVLPLTQDQTYETMGLPWAAHGAQPDAPAAMIGSGCMGQAEVVPVALALGHLLLLCSDGLHRGLDATRMAAILAQAPTLEDAALQLVQAARAAGSTDDITVLLAHATAPAPGRPPSLRGLLQRVFHRVANLYEGGRRLR